MKKLIFFCLIFILGCATTQLKVNSPIIINSNLENVFIESLKSLQSKDYLIGNADKPSGIITTEWKEKHNILARIRTKFEFIMRSINENQTELIIRPIAQMYNVNEWQILDDVGDKNIKFINEIIDEIKLNSESN